MKPQNPKQYHHLSLLLIYMTAPLTIPCVRVHWTWNKMNNILLNFDRFWIYYSICSLWLWSVGRVCSLFGIHTRIRVNHVHAYVRSHIGCALIRRCVTCYYIYAQQRFNNTWKCDEHEHNWKRCVYWACSREYCVKWLSIRNPHATLVMYLLFVVVVVLEWTLSLVGRRCD